MNDRTEQWSAWMFAGIQSRVANNLIEKFVLTNFQLKFIVFDKLRDAIAFTLETRVKTWDAPPHGPYLTQAVAMVQWKVLK